MEDSVSLNFPICQKHHQRFRNFCKAKTCMHALCPDCIDEHTQYHGTINIKPDIVSLKSVANKCHTLLKDLISQLAKDSEEMIGFVTIKRSQVASSYDKNLLTLRDVRMLLENTLKKHIFDIQLKLKAVMHNLNDLLNKPNGNIKAIQEIRTLDNAIDNPSTMIQSLVETMNLEFDKIISKSKSQTLKQTNSVQQFILPLQVDSQLPQKLVQLLQKSILIGKFPTRNTLDSEQNKSSSKMFMRAPTIELENSLQHYKESILKQALDSPIKKSSAQRQLNVSKFQAQIIEIKTPNTFNLNSHSQHLHYFESNSKKLYLLPLNKPGAGIIKKNLDIRFFIPEGYQSITTPDGQIYLFGGDILNSPIKSQKIYRYSPDQQSLEYMGNMIDGRSYASLCYSYGLIYIIGGVTSNNKTTSKCQTYNIATREVEIIGECLQATSSAGVCTFGTDLIYKFGGLLQGGKAMTNTIQKYDKLAEKWKIVQPILNKSIDELKLLCHTNAIQINKEEILLMGGKGQFGIASTQCIIFNAEYESITSEDKYPIPLGEGFNSGSACIHNGMVYALENAYKKANVPDYKIVIIFDGYKWRTLS